MKNNDSIKNSILIVFKESMKFALVATIIFLIIGISIIYVLVIVLKMEESLSALFAGVISAIIIVMIDFKKLHTTEKITESNRIIFRKILRKLINIKINGDSE